MTHTSVLHVQSIYVAHTIEIVRERGFSGPLEKRFTTLSFYSNRL